MQRQTIPALFMLIAAAFTSIVTFILDFSIQRALVFILVSIIVFYFLGLLIKRILDGFEEQNEQAVLDEGEVLEQYPVPAVSLDETTGQTEE